MQIFHNPSYNFLKYRWYALVMSWAIIIAGIAMVSTRGLAEGGGIVGISFVRPPSGTWVSRASDRSMASKLRATTAGPRLA